MSNMMIGDLVLLNYEIIKLTIIEYMMTSHNEQLKIINIIVMKQVQDNIH